MLQHDASLDEKLTYDQITAADVYESLDEKDDEIKYLTEQVEQLTDEVEDLNKEVDRLRDERDALEDEVERLTKLLEEES